MSGPSQFVPMPTDGIKLLQGFYCEPTIDRLKRMMDIFVFDTKGLTDDLMQARLDNMLARHDHLDNLMKSLAAGMQHAVMPIFGRCGPWAQREHAEKSNRMVADFWRIESACGRRAGRSGDVYCVPLREAG